MNTKKLRQLMDIMLVAWLLAGCGGATPEPAATPTANPPTATPVLPTATPLSPTATPIPPTATPVPPTDAVVPPAATEAPGDLQPLSADACNDLANTTAQTLGVAVTTAEVPFQDYVGGKAGTSCRATATGTGLDFENYMAVADALRETLGSQGWQADLTYAADGPNGTGNGFRKGNALCLFSVGWEPSADANCPSDQPISACELSPEQQLYTITLNCAQDSAPPTEATETLGIDSFSAEAVDNDDGGKTVTFNWQTSGATGVRIFNGATFVRFGTWWTDLPPDGTHSVEIANTVFKNPVMTLFAADAQGNEISQEIRIDMPCQVKDKFRGNSTPSGTICAAEAIETPAAEQRFDRGFMIWLKDVGGGTILVFHEDGRVNQYPDTWQPDQPESNPNLTPPSGLYQPVRGFGKVWRENSLGATLGWAIEEEVGFSGKWQRDMSPSPSSDSAYLINRDFQLIRIDGPTSGGNWEFIVAVD